MIVRLRDLLPEWYGMPRIEPLEYRPGKFRESEVHPTVETFAEAVGVRFLCPLCFARAAKGATVHVHSIHCWGPNVPQDFSPRPGRWHMQGRGFDDLTLAGVTSDSVDLGDRGCRAHFYVRNGVIEFAGGSEP